MAQYRYKPSGDIYTAHGVVAEYYDRQPDYELYLLESGAESGTAPVTLDSMSVPELRGFAAQHKVNLPPDTADKAVIIAAITEGE